MEFLFLLLVAILLADYFTYRSSSALSLLTLHTIKFFKKLFGPKNPPTAGPSAA